MLAIETSRLQVARKSYEKLVMSTKNFTTSGARQGQFDRRRSRGRQGYLRALETGNPSGFHRMRLPRPAIPEHR